MTRMAEATNDARKRDWRGVSFGNCMAGAQAEWEYMS
jgi:hypothetical protein